MAKPKNELKEQVMDLLNQIVVLTANTPKPQQVEDYNSQAVILTKDRYEDLLNDHKSDNEDDEEGLAEGPRDYNGKKLKVPNDEEIYLYCVHEIAKRAVEGDADSVAYNENQYYNSNC